MTETVRKNNKRASILGFPVDLVSMSDALDIADKRITSSMGGHVVTINPEMIMQSKKTPALENILKQAEIIIPDGSGIIFALKKLGIKDVVQLPGIEFSEALIDKCAKSGYTVGFLGASKEALETTIKKFQLKYPEIKIVFSQDGYFTDENEPEIVQKLKETQPQVLLVALGVPKQELWIAKYKETLNSTLMIGVGGSFDVWSDKVKRAPEIFRKFGLEWLFRLISQPSRFSRMFPTLPLFLLKVLLDNKTTRKEY